jgi:hypothetical protein
MKYSWRVLIWITVFIAITGLVLLLFMRKPPSMDRAKDPCSYGTGVWECNFSVNNTDPFSAEVVAALSPYSTRCRADGGDWSCRQNLPFDIICFCDFPLDDAGKECRRSSDCQGTCVLSKEFLDNQYPKRESSTKINCTFCTGNCSQWIFRDCGGWIELNNDVITDFSGMRCSLFE